MVWKASYFINVVSNWVISSLVFWDEEEKHLMLIIAFLFYWLYEVKVVFIHVLKIFKVNLLQADKIICKVKCNILYVLTFAYFSFYIWTAFKRYLYLG